MPISASLPICTNDYVICIYNSVHINKHSLNVNILKNTMLSISGDAKMNRIESVPLRTQPADRNKHINNHNKRHSMIYGSIREKFLLYFKYKTYFIVFIHLSLSNSLVHGNWRTTYSKVFSNLMSTVQIHIHNLGLVSRYDMKM